MSEHMASFFVFGLLHAALAIQYIQKMLPPRSYQGARRGGSAVHCSVRSNSVPVQPAAGVRVHGGSGYSTDAACRAD
jgi:hypothetical protein